MSLSSAISAPTSSLPVVLYSPSAICLEVLLRDNTIRVLSRKDQGAALHIMKNRNSCEGWSGSSCTLLLLVYNPEIRYRLNQMQCVCVWPVWLVWTATHMWYWASSYVRYWKSVCVGAKKAKGQLVAAKAIQGFLQPCSPTKSWTTQTKLL